MDNLEYIQQNRVNILSKILKLLVFVISMYSLIRLNEHNYFQASIDIAYVFIGIVCYYKLYNNPQLYTTIVRFLFFISILISIYVLSSLHDSPMRFLWIATVVYTIFYLFDKKEGIFWTLYIATLLLVLMIYNKNILAIEWIDFIILLTNMVVVTTIASWYAKVEKESTQRFIDAKNMLTKEVEIKTAQLQAKTKELQELNNNLEEKIAEKIKENRKHEEILFKQAKFAQIGEMINMIAHQWRQPLNAISTTNVSLMLKLQEEEHINRDDIINKLNRMSNYIQNLSNTIDDFRITYNETMQIDRANLQEIINQSRSQWCRAWTIYIQDNYR
jgi:signal transduction histidine kinase